MYIRKKEISFKNWFNIYFKPATIDNKSLWIFLSVFIITALVIFKLKDIIIDEFWSGVLVEATGFLFDILLFGILFTIYDSISSKKKLITSYKNEIAIFERWNTREATHRIIGNIRLLNLEKVTNIDLFETGFFDVKMEKIDFTDSIFDDNNFTHCSLHGSIFKSIELYKDYFGDCHMVESNISNCNAQYVRFTNCYMENVNFEKSILKDIEFKECYISGTSFRDAELVNVNFNYSIVNDEDWLNHLRIPNKYHEQLAEKYAIINKIKFLKKSKNEYIESRLPTTHELIDGEWKETSNHFIIINRNDLTKKKKKN